jgi:putative spermidine/putrescine transport system ATP-binding protein
MTDSTTSVSETNTQVAERQPETAGVRLSDLTKTFGPVTAVDGVDLDIHEGEFFSMLGPSGSGKTTVLRLVAGFEKPTRGSVLLGGEDVTDKAPFQRDVNTVFQDYALFPHMNVRENVAYGLRVRKVPKRQRLEMADEALTTVRLHDVGDRRPSQLSGGQQQRVALARALVIQPKVLLLDEPLGALDRKLRQEMQIELKELQRQVGITFVFVTHDQEEALTMSDRIAVFNDGRVEQVGAPADVYERPRTPFVADFVGTSNLLDDGASQRVLGKPGRHAVRPEKINVTTDLNAPADPETEFATGTVTDVVYAGSATRFVVDVGDGARLVAVRQNEQSTSEDVGRLRGKEVRLSWSKEHLLQVDEPR